MHYRTLRRLGPRHSGQELLVTAMPKTALLTFLSSHSGGSTPPQCKASLLCWVLETMATVGLEQLFVSVTFALKSPSGLTQGPLCLLFGTLSPRLMYVYTHTHTTWPFLLLIPQVQVSLISGGPPVRNCLFLSPQSQCLSISPYFVNDLTLHLVFMQLPEDRAPGVHPHPDRCIPSVVSTSEEALHRHFSEE